MKGDAPIVTEDYCVPNTVFVILQLWWIYCTFFMREMLVLDYTELIGVSEPKLRRSVSETEEYIETNDFRLLEGKVQGTDVIRKLAWGETSYKGRMLSRVRVSLCLYRCMVTAQRSGWQHCSWKGSFRWLGRDWLHFRLTGLCLH